MTVRVIIAILLTVTICLTTLARGGSNNAQGGDQFLDGIGETSLIARYVFNGNAEDSSRNQLHAACAAPAARSWTTGSAGCCC